jgi:hypothetical protein
MINAGTIIRDRVNVLFFSIFPGRLFAAAIKDDRITVSENFKIIYSDLIVLSKPRFINRHPVKTHETTNDAYNKFRIFRPVKDDDPYPGNF